MHNHKEIIKYILSLEKNIDSLFGRYEGLKDIIIDVNKDLLELTQEVKRLKGGRRK